MHRLITAYGEKLRVKVDNDEPSLTKQAFTHECDINNILAKYQKTGAIEHLNQNEASYGYATSDNFQESLEIVSRGQNMFNELPSSIRNKFKNDPAQFLEFVQNSDNIEEMRELGLAHKKQNKEMPSVPAKTSEAPIAESDAKKPASAPETGS